jgi:pimeloyl-ACP methyl ester carboxylesterase
MVKHRDRLYIAAQYERREELMSEPPKPADSGDSADILRGWGAGLAADAVAYAIDAAQRTILFADVLRQRGDQFRDYMAGKADPVLSYEFEVVARGTDLPRPINYALVRIVPPEGMTVDPKKRPFVVVDPRAGHGPGIGGFKADSEIGMALRAGHPCYFIGFLPQPEPGQTIEDVAKGEAAFLERVIARHPEAEGRPAVIGNCQAGWAVMIVAALRPELFGPIIIAGAPLSYWAGTRGFAPMRYTGGLLGGSWLTALTGDLGGGKFDGAWLVKNFEGMNPANTWWTKQYNVWAKVDTEAERYLGFERWWGGHVTLNAEEMQYIVDNLFVGNKLATAEMVTADGLRIDLRNIRSPVVCFCSRGDDITPPPQALGWILDLYESVDDIRAHGQTIVYCVHETIGHLGIFVSGSVARKEHDEFASNIDFIDCLPPGLYEAVILGKREGDANVDMVTGDYVLRFEGRDLDAIRAYGCNDAEDERRFATVARLSEINLGLYRSFAQPFARALASPAMTQWLAKLNPVRLPFELLSSDNPLMAPVARMAEQVRTERRPVGPDNPFVQLQEKVSSGVVETLTAWGEARDKLVENLFMATFGSPLLQAMVGLRASDAPPRRRPGEEPEHHQFVRAEIERLKGRIDQGDVREAAVRALIWVLWPQKATDERSFNQMRQLRRQYGSTHTLADFKALVREQAQMLQIDADRAIAAIPTLLARDPDLAARTIEDLRRVVTAGGPLNEEGAARLVEIERLFAQVVPGAAPAIAEVEVAAPKPAAAPPAPSAPAEKTKPARRPRGDRRQATGRGRGG